MKRLLVTLGFPPDVGGMQQFLYARCQASDAEQIVVLAPNTSGSLAFDADQSFEIHRWGNVSKCIPGVKRLEHIVLPLYHVWRLRRFQEYDAIECGQALPCGIVALVARWKLNVPYIVWAHGNDILKPQRWTLTRWLLTEVLCKAARVVANSHDTAERVKRLGVEPHKIRVIHPPVDHDRFHPDVDPEQVLREHNLSGRKVLLTVARLYPRKGIDMVIRTLPRVTEEIQDAVYVVVGDGPERGRLGALAASLGLDEHVVFAGQVPDAILPAYYAACDVFVMLSRTIETQGEIEGFGIVYLEAGACGKPVIGGDSGGAKEAIEEGVTGLIVDPRSPTALAKAIIRLLQDESLAHRLGCQGRQRACQPTDWTALENISGDAWAGV